MWTLLLDIFLMSFQKGKTPAIIVGVVTVIVIGLAIFTMLRDSVS